MVQMINEDFLGPKDLRLNGLDFANGAHKIPKIAIQWFGIFFTNIRLRFDQMTILELLNMIRSSDLDCGIQNVWFQIKKLVTL